MSPVRVRPLRLFAAHALCAAPHCRRSPLRGRRTRGGAMRGSPRRAAAHCETAHGGDLRIAPGPKETQRSRRLATELPRRGPTPMPCEPRTAHTPNEAARALRPCPRSDPPTTPVPTERPAHYARAHGATHALRPRPRGVPSTAPPPTGRPTHCAPTHRSSLRTAPLSPCARTPNG